MRFSPPFGVEATSVTTRCREKPFIVPEIGVRLKTCVFFTRRTVQGNAGCRHGTRQPFPRQSRTLEKGPACRWRSTFPDPGNRRRCCSSPRSARAATRLSPDDALPAQRPFVLFWIARVLAMPMRATSCTRDRGDSDCCARRRPSARSAWRYGSRGIRFAQGRTRRSPARAHRRLRFACMQQVRDGPNECDGRALLGHRR